MIDAKTLEQENFFRNRLVKTKKHLLRWAKKNMVYCFRVYDKDIPEIPLCVDLYYDNSWNEPYVVFALYKRPYEKDKSEEEIWLSRMKAVMVDVFETNIKKVFFKLRQKKKDNFVFQDFSNKQSEKKIIVVEGQAKFYVRLNSFLDTGLFLDHRFLRRHIFKTAKDKNILNLFCYTGSFSVQAKLGGSKKVCSVDLSENYLSWAKENFKLSGLNPYEENFIAIDIFDFLNLATLKNSFNARSEKFKKIENVNQQIKAELLGTYDIIICDAPTFSNSKKTKTVLDIKKDWALLCELCLKLLADDGVFYFSCNSKTIKLNRNVLLEFTENFYAKYKKKLFVKDLSNVFLDEDFKGRKPHTLLSFEFTKE